MRPDIRIRGEIKEKPKATPAPFENHKGCATPSTYKKVADRPRACHPPSLTLLKDAAALATATAAVGHVAVGFVSEGGSDGVPPAGTIED